MVNGELYLDTGFDSTVEARCGMMDGQITSTVKGWEKPTKDDQSNFGTGYGYQYGAEGTIEIFLNENWRIYATEEVRQDMQFPERSGFVWGVELFAEDVTKTGMKLVCTQSEKVQEGELMTGSWYELEQRIDGEWQPVTPVIQDAAWNAEGWVIPMENTVEWEVNWEWLYGELSPGQYRINKEIMHFRGTGDYDKMICRAYFEVEEN